MARLRSGLARWLAQARDAGLEDEDVEALLASVIVEDARRSRAEHATQRTAAARR